MSRRLLPYVSCAKAIARHWSVRESVRTMLAPILFDRPREGRAWNDVHQLREQGLARGHDDLQAETWQTEHACGSSQHHPFLPGNRQKSWRSEEEWLG